MKLGKGTTRQETYKSQLKKKKEELTAVLKDSGEAKSHSEKLRLNRLMESLLTEIDDVERKLSNLSNLSIQLDRGIVNRKFEKSLQKIDFSEARKIAKIIKDKFEVDGGAILLFLQKSKKQCGKYCVEEFIDIIMSEQIIDGQIEGDYRRYSIDLSSPNYSPNEEGFIKGASGHFGINNIDLELKSNLEEDSKKLIETMCSSMSVRSTIFLEIKNINKIVELERENFLNWFLNNFWRSLVDKINTEAKQKRNRVIAAFIADTKFSIDSSLLNHSGQTNTLHFDKIFEIPLPDWTFQEIYDWLIRFRTLSSCFENMKPLEIENVARDIFEESDGTPESVYLRLREKIYGSI